MASVQMVAPIKKVRAFLQEHLDACQSSRIRIYSIERDVETEITPQQIFSIKQQIAELDILIKALSKSSAGY